MGPRETTRIRTGSGPAGARLARRTRLAWLAVVASPVVTHLLVNRSRPGIAAITATALVLLTVTGPAAVLGLIPLSTLTDLLPDGARTTVIAVAVIVTVTAVRVVAGAGRFRMEHPWIGLLILLLVIACAFPDARLVPPPDRIADLTGLLAGLALLAAVVAAPPPARAVAQVTALVGMVVAMAALPMGEHPGGRLQALGLNPNFLGAYFAIPLVAAAGLVRWHRRPWWLLSAAVCLAGMAATQSRGAFTAAAVGTALVITPGRRRVPRFLIVSAATAFATLLPGPADVVRRAVVGGRQAAELSRDTAIRGHVAEVAARTALRHPLRGIGYGMFPSYAEGSPDLGIYIATHNDYLRLAAEAGLPTLTVFLVLLLSGLRGRVTSDLAIVRAMTIAYAVGLLFANELADLVVSTPFWLALGCLLAARHHREIGSLRYKGVIHDR